MTGPCQEVAEKGREAGRGRREGLVDGSDKPVGDARLAGEEDVLLASKKAIESPKLSPLGEGAADGGHCANRLLARLSGSPGRRCGVVASRWQRRMSSRLQQRARATGKPRQGPGPGSGSDSDSNSNSAGESAGVAGASRGLHGHRDGQCQSPSQNFKFTEPE